MTTRRLRVLTLNCWNVSEPLEARIALLRDEIRRWQPDLVGLQEIVVRGDGFDLSSLILGDEYERAFGAAFRWDGNGNTLPHDGEGDAFGNAIGSRWPIRRFGVHPLPGAESGERRSVAAARIETPAGTIAFLATHLNWKLHHGAVREEQVVELSRLAQEWSAGTDLPPVVVGDMNAEPDSTEIRFLAGLATIGGRSVFLQDAWRVAGDGGPGYTWDNRNPYAAYNFEPNRRIDYIFVGAAALSGRGWIDDVRLVATEPRDGVFATDHFGLCADVRV